MALKTKQSELKAIIASQKEEMAMKCSECLGFFVDGYEPCTSTACPLRKSFPTSSYISQGSFVEKMKAKAKELGNDKDFINRITGKQEKLPEGSKKAEIPKVRQTYQEE